MTDENTERKANGQFQKGISGNPKGRKKKLERSYGTHQQRLDILEVFEEEIEYTTNGKKRKDPAIKILYKMILKEVIDQKDIKSAMKIIEMLENVLRSLEARYWKIHDQIEGYENSVLKHGTEPDRFDIDHINRLRRKTRGI